MKKIKIEIKVKKPWEAARGHDAHRSGSGKHDDRPKRERTRGAKLRKILKEEI